MWKDRFENCNQQNSAQPDNTVPQVSTSDEDLRGSSHQLYHRNE
jgi:hypothetical protein